MAASIINNVQPCGLEHIKNVTHSKRRKCHCLKLSHSILTVYGKFDTILLIRNQFEICTAKSE